MLNLKRKQELFELLRGTIREDELDKMWLEDIDRMEPLIEKWMEEDRRAEAQPAPSVKEIAAKHGIDTSGVESDNREALGIAQPAPDAGKWAVGKWDDEAVALARDVLHRPVCDSWPIIAKALERAAGQQAAQPTEDYKAAWEEINQVRDRANKLIDAKYLGWNWVHALVDKLESLTDSRTRT